MRMKRFAYLDTHYYGGIKKYQWVTLPLAMHGVIAKKDGSVVTINIGEKPEDPVFGVSDLLIHLSADQLEKKAAKVIEGEALDILGRQYAVRGQNRGREENKRTGTGKCSENFKRCLRCGGRRFPVR